MSKVQEKKSAVESPAMAPVLWNPEDRWPRMMQWLDAWLPTDVGWRLQPHTLRMEEFQQDGTLTLRIEFPGIDPDKDVDITIDSGILTVTGRRSESDQSPQHSEFYYGEFFRSVPLPRGIDEGSVNATYDNGILEITMRMPEANGQKRHVPVARRSAT